MEVWREGAARLSSDLLGVRGEVESWRGSRLLPGEQWACTQPVRMRKKVLDEVSFSGSSFFFFFSFYSEIGTVLGKWDRCHQSRDRAVYPTQPRGHKGLILSIQRKLQFSGTRGSPCRLGTGIDLLFYMVSSKGEMTILTPDRICLWYVHLFLWAKGSIFLGLASIPH